MYKKPAEHYLPSDFMLASFSAYFSTPKMDAIYSFDTSVEFQHTTKRYVPEDSTIHDHRCENLKSYLAPTVEDWFWTIFTTM
jgi:hypothetical protein